MKIGLSLLNDKDNSIIEPLAERILGRFASKRIIHPETKEVILEAGEMISENVVAKVVKAGIKKVEIRSVLTCKSSPILTRNFTP